MVYSSCSDNGCDSKDHDKDCDSTIPQSNADSQYRQYMRQFVISISMYARTLDPDFIIIPQNGQEIVTIDSKIPATTYLNAINGLGREDLNYGYCDDNVLTDSAMTAYINTFLDDAKNAGKTILVTDYVSSTGFADDAYAKNKTKGYISFAADHRDLNNIPFYPHNPRDENSNDITVLSDAKNFLYLIDPGKYNDKSLFLSAIRQTNFDLIIIDLFCYSNVTDAEEPLTAVEINSLKTKQNGGQRLILAYMSIGEAENYRYYWQRGWGPGSPGFIIKENPEWEGNYIVKYWDESWQDIILGNSNSYVDKVIDARFDGVYLDIIDAFEYFEANAH